MKIPCLILLSLFFFSKTFSQTYTPEKLGFKHYSINHKMLGQINYYVSLPRIKAKKQILLYLDGSGAIPLFQYTKGGIGSTVPLNTKELSEKFHVVLISKPGVPFIDSMLRDTRTGRPLYKEPRAYTDKLSLQWRVEASKVVVQDVMHKLKTNNKVSVLGISEGFQVGAKLIEEYDRVSQAILFVGNGLSQFYDFIIHNRMLEQAGKISSTTAQKNIDSLNRTFTSIYNSPTSTTKKWYGHTYLRWSSFANNSPMENLLSSDIPIYLVGCSKDLNTSVLSTDYLYLEAIRRKKKNIQYKVLPYDHSFNERILDQNGETLSNENHMREEIEKAISWLTKQL